MANHNNLGYQGENAAVIYLQNKGFTILKRNWRHRRIEIDIIATDQLSLIFIEVKTRKSARWGNPEDAVTDIKIRRMVDAADFYANEYNIDMPIRFDIISILQEGTDYQITHFEDAFLAPLN
ncbi:YraN family protein [Dysgonomonas sp. 216]|uniref:YraN family protein n=1 Tax=Dysgonomonas sp. 216 TaxID=2302934 RepID=UPI0013D53F05|nr:YraN family protein [Dysgonomonas sp. 216]NDW18336.1 YraN family protein [Dysgonomonas sp. 216]NDW18704.1 YraN family protein [Dysgonomonas sp. 216]